MAASAASLVAAVQAIESDNQKEDRMRDAPDRTSVTDQWKERVPDDGRAGRPGQPERPHAGYTALTPGWPDDPETVEEANAHPEVFAHKTVGQVAELFSEVIGRLETRPAVIGHSFGGLLAQIVAGRGLSAATVAIDPAPFRGVSGCRFRP